MGSPLFVKPQFLLIHGDVQRPRFFLTKALGIENLDVPDVLTHPNFENKINGPYRVSLLDSGLLSSPQIGGQAATGMIFSITSNPHFE